ncbi:MAG TPA: TIGR02996 domain-containing protein [Kofleriaceae bacterium]|jgi:uncharacterized protein (TIGR02996 family)
MDLVHGKGRAQKYWMIWQHGRELKQVWAPAKGAERTRLTKYKSAKAAKQKYDALMAAKYKEGYRDVYPAEPAVVAPSPTASSATRDAALEAALRAAPDDRATYAVYSDWLQAHGNPLGEIMALALADKKLSPKRLEALGLPSEQLATFGWRWGMWDWLRLENSVDWMDDKFDAVVLARTMFDMAPCAALRELRIGVLRWDHNHDDVPAVLAEAAKRAWARDLRSLHLGDVDDNVDMAHHVIGVVGTSISKAFPKLRALRLHSSAQTWRGKGVKTFGLAGLELPELESLTIETCSLAKARAKELCAAKLPKLTELELWFGMKEFGANAALADVAPILDAKAFPHIVSLGLCNTEHACDLADALPHGKLAPQLARVSLAKGTLDDDAAETLASNAAAFPRLVRLDVSESFLTAAAIARLGRAFGKRVTIVADDQRLDPDDDDEGRADEARYVAVYE